MTGETAHFPSEISVANAGHARIVAQLQIDFGAEFGEPEPPVAVLEPRFRKMIESPAAFVLLIGDPESPDGPDGYAVVTLRPSVYTDGDLAVLDELYVVPRLRGRGIGSQLIDRVIAQVLERGGGELHINVDEVDTDARRFYVRHGFANGERGFGRELLYSRDLEN